MQRYQNVFWFILMGLLAACKTGIAISDIQEYALIKASLTTTSTPKTETAILLPIQTLTTTSNPQTSTPKPKPLPTQPPIPHTNTAPVMPVKSTSNLTAPATPTIVGTSLSQGFEPVIHNTDWALQIDIFNGVEMALVPAGCFEMGSTNEQVDNAMRQCEKFRGAGNCERSWYQDEQPVKKKCFEEPFWIDVYEVTNAQFGSSGEWSGDELPRERVNWDDAVTHCKSRGARLPTEAEWEYAARGPDELMFPWGDAFKRAFVNSCDSSCEFNLIGTRVDDGYANTAPVGSYPEGISWVGAMDMSGNVWEWTSSIYMDYPYTATDGREVNDITDSSNKRVLRGGSWFHTGSDLLRSAARYGVSPDFTDYVLGFRCAIPFMNTPTPPTPTVSTTNTPLLALSGSGGDVIAFVSDRDGNFEIFVMKADGSEPWRVTDNPAYDSWPSWSPDGSQIVFASWREGDGEICVMDANGSNLQKLTDNRFEEELPAWQPNTAASNEPKSEASDTNTFLGDTWTRPADGAVMVFVAGGSFQMGSTPTQLEATFELCEHYRGKGKCRRDWFEDEAPAHIVTLDSFWIDLTEVTNQQ
jgi:formylglycine-generating enzyme required for sulfatase activity